jgi:NAD(P)-dependent dehydrogenase (short-subunit alcohol dehydrogenase family)
MKKQKIIITGSEGLLGKQISNYLAKKFHVYKLDLKLGNDLTNEKFVKKWFSNNKASSLVNCFALNDIINSGEKRGTIFDITLESYSKFLDINLTALFSVCREFARNNKKGTIVNFSATTGMVSARPDLYCGKHKHPGYSVSKAGVINLTKFLATHLAPNIRVNCVAPGGVDVGVAKSFQQKYSKLTPMKRMMKRNELNKIVEYLCTKESSYVTGANFVVDGGWTSW